MTTLIPDKTICMDFCHSLRIILVFSFTFVELTILMDKYLSANFVIPIYLSFVFSFNIAISLALHILSYFFQSARKGMSNSMSWPKIAVPVEAFSTVWYVQQKAHATLVRKSATVLGFTELAISNSAVHIMFVNIPCTCSRMAFA